MRNQKLKTMIVGDNLVLLVLILDVMRHGQRNKSPEGKSLDELTDLGRQQMRMSAETHLKDRRYGRALHTGTNRTQQGLTEVLSVLGQTPRVEECRASGYEWLDNDATLPPAAYPDCIERLTVYEALQVAPRCFAFRVRNQQVMQDLAAQEAEDVIQRISGGEYVLDGQGVPVMEMLMTNHSCVGEMAVPKPADFPILGLADIASYQIHVRRNGVNGRLAGEIVSATYLPRLVQA